MAISLVCPRLMCRAVLQVPEEARGKRVRCSECGNTFVVPEAWQTVEAKKASKDKQKK